MIHQSTQITQYHHVSNKKPAGVNASVHGALAIGVCENIMWGYTPITASGEKTPKAPKVTKAPKGIFLLKFTFNPPTMQYHDLCLKFIALGHKTNIVIFIH